MEKSLENLLQETSTKVFKEFWIKAEESLLVQKYCYLCCKKRPEDISQLLTEGWQVRQTFPKVIPDDVRPAVYYDPRYFSYTIEMHISWLCKDCGVIK